MPMPQLTTISSFVIVIDGLQIASFADLGGIVSEIEPVSYLEGGGGGPIQLPGKVKPPQVTLCRGRTGTADLWAWHQSARNGQMAVARRDCTLTMYDHEGTPVPCYLLEHAWPSKIEVSALRDGPGEMLYNSVTLVCENLHHMAA
ncbi:phage tail protein [Nocardia sp. NPDC056611]|uniref:phage tail protein n=1 Tax=Nocardia sp. NPDC056611 TaxID=3345877 RepID=UPI00366AC437